MASLRCGVLTVSDRVSRGEAEDTSGPNLGAMLRAAFSVADLQTAVVPDEVPAIQQVLTRWADELQLDLVLTTGGTGFAPRDVTPEATKPLLTKEANGLVIAMTVASLKKTPHACLSRYAAGLRNRTLIVNVPGSKKASSECLEAILASLPHALQLAADVIPHAHPPPADGQRPAAATAAPVQPADGAHQHHHHHHGGCPHHGGGHAHPLPQGVVGRDRKSRFPMLTVDEALALIERHTPAAAAAAFPFADGLGATAALSGLVVAEDVVAAHPFPPFRASVKDGYAVRSADGAGEFAVQGDLVAGADPHSLRLLPGNVIRVTTGSPVPDGADAVVQVEDTQLLEADKATDRELRVAVLRAARPGQDVRPVGVDIAQGQAVLPKGTVLRAAELGLLCALGVTEVKAYRRPRVAVLSTGDELASCGAELAPGHIYDSNRSMLLNAIRDTGFEAVDLGIAPDTTEAITAGLLRGLAEADVVLTSGGVSMGELDLIKPILAAQSAALHFGRVSMKPGKPTTFATVEREGGRRCFFGLPGNPVSCLVCYYVFVLPALRKLAGLPQRTLPTVRARLDSAIRPDPERAEYHRAVLRWGDSGFTATSTGLQDSHRLLSLRSSNALLVLPAGSEPLPAGAEVTAMVTGPLE